MVERQNGQRSYADRREPQRCLDKPRNPNFKYKEKQQAVALTHDALLENVNL